MSSEIEKMFDNFHCKKCNPETNCDWFSDVDRLFSMTDTEIMEQIHTFNSLDKECDITISAEIRTGDNLCKLK